MPLLRLAFFPSSYRNDAAEETTTRVDVEGENNQRVGRQGHEARYSSFSASVPGRKDRTSYEKEEVKVYEDDRERRPRRKEDVTVYEERQESDQHHHHRDHHHDDHHHHHRPEVDITRERFRDSDRHHTETKIEVEVPRRKEEIDITERDYRRRTDPNYDVEFERRPHHHHHHHDREERVDVETTVDPPHRSKMGYYDDEGHYHSFRHGLEKAADRVFHPFSHDHGREEVIIEKEDRVRGPTRVRDGMEETVRYVERRGRVSGTITIPCHHIRIGDLLILQGRPCQVIRITTSAQTGQHRYLGVDLFTKQLHEESSFVSNPSPSVIVQNMLGPVFKQYRVLDIRDDGRVVAMTETGDVKQGLPVIDQGGLWSRLNDSFANGRGSVRVLVINDGGRELAVDYKVIHGSRL
ncbi:hypothetical protein MMC21_004440 [Puttea exsequens]|nr:hypothetical protein [Puttea exsequens]